MIYPNRIKHNRLQFLLKITVFEFMPLDKKCVYSWDRCGYFPSVLGPNIVKLPSSVRKHNLLNLNFVSYDGNTCPIYNRRLGRKSSSSILRL